jgi:hypothetical protein
VVNDFSDYDFSSHLTPRKHATPPKRGCDG